MPLPALVRFPRRRCTAFVIDACLSFVSILFLLCDWLCGVRHLRGFGVSLELWHASTNRCLCYNATPAATLTLPQSRRILPVVHQSSFVAFSVGFFRVGVSLRLSLRPILQHHANDSAAHWQPSSCGPAATPLPLSPPVHLILLPLSYPFPLPFPLLCGVAPTTCCGCVSKLALQLPLHSPQALHLCPPRRIAPPPAPSHCTTPPCV